MPGEEDPQASLWWTLAYLPHKLGTGLFVPILPLFVLAAGATAGQVGIMESLFAGSLILGTYVWGRASDAVDARRPFIILGFLGSYLSLAAFVVFPQVPVKVAARAAMGFLVAAPFAVGSALVAEVGPDDGVGTRVARLEAVMSWSYALGLGVSFVLLSGVDMGTVFIVAVALTALATAAAILLVPGQERRWNRQHLFDVLEHLGEPFIARWEGRDQEPEVAFEEVDRGVVQGSSGKLLSAVFLGTLAGAAALVLLPIYLLEVGIAVRWVPGAFLVLAGADALLTHPAGHLVDRVGPRPVKLAGHAVRAAGVGLLALPQARVLPAILVLLALTGAGLSMIKVTGPVGLFHSLPHRPKGEVVGYFRMAMGGGKAVGGALAGLVVTVAGFPQLFLLGAGLSTMALALTAWTYTHGELPAPATSPS